MRFKVPQSRVGMSAANSGVGSVTLGVAGIVALVAGKPAWVRLALLGIAAFLALMAYIAWNQGYRDD